jgi:hypothetical protein
MEPLYWDGEQKCTAAAVTLDIFTETGAVVKMFFEDMSATKQLPWSVIDSLPHTYNGTPTTDNTSFSAVRNDDWSSVFFKFVSESIMEQYLGISPSAIKVFFTDAPGIPRDILTVRNIAKDMFMCDFESVMLCSRHNRRIFLSLIVSYLLYLIIATMLGFVGLRGVAGVLFYLIPFVSLWLAYGLSPTCIPMIPTCMLSDIIESLQVVVPAKITWPDSLQVYPGCIGPPWYDPNATVVIPPQFSNITAGSSACLLSCRGAPFYFETWESSLAWVTCTLDARTCVTLEIPYFPNFTTHTQQYSPILLAGTNNTDVKAVDTGAAYSFCFWVTFARVVPYILLFISLLLLVVSMIQLPFMLTTAAVQCIVQAFVYTHT